MKELLLSALNASISASWLIAAVLLLRLVFKKAPKWISVMLWGIVALRLIFPFSIESPLSLIPSSQTLPDKVISGPRFDIQSGIAPVDNYVNDYLGERYFEGITVPANNGAHVMTVLSIIWLAGAALLIAYALLSYLRLRRNVASAVLLSGNMFQCEGISSPFVLGFFKPKIYLPFNLPPDVLDYVAAHEQSHISRRDHIWKPLGFLLLAVYWFNPLVWLSYILLCRDIELACDEKSVKTLGSECKADYSQALLACSAERHIAAACPLSFAETGVKERVKHVLNYKKPAFWIILAAVLACIILAVCFLTDPPSASRSPVIYAGGESSSVSAYISNGRVSLYFTAPDGECGVSFNLPSGMGVDTDENDPSQVFITNKKSERIGSVSVHSLATRDRDELSAVNTAEDSLPMPVFATLALSNHVGFDKYSVVSHSDSGAVARADYSWQDLSEEYDSAAELPFHTADSVLAYDYNASPYYFLFIVSTDKELSYSSGLNEIAETLRFTNIYATAEPEVSPSPAEPSPSEDGGSSVTPVPPDVSSTPDTRIDDIEKLFNSMPVNGMVLSEYSDVRDVSLYEILYQCSDESISQSSINEAYKNETDTDVETDITYMSASALDKLLTSLTGYGLAEFRNSDRITYLETLDAYCVQHGDTNYSPVKCAGIDELGGGLIAVSCTSELEGADMYLRGEDGEYLFVKEITVTLREVSGGYQFVSNKAVG